MITSATLAESEISVLNAILPDGIQVRLEAGKLLMEFRSSPASGDPVALFAYEIAPVPQADFSGPALTELLEDLAGTVGNLMRGLNDAARDHPFQQILQVVNGAVESVRARRVAGNRFRVLTHEIHSSNLEDWRR
jgi:hypothetical protein